MEVDATPHGHELMLHQPTIKGIRNRGYLYCTSQLGSIETGKSSKGRSGLIHGQGDEDPPMPQDSAALQEHPRGWTREAGSVGSKLKPV